MGGATESGFATAIRRGSSVSRIVQARVRRHGEKTLAVFVDAVVAADRVLAAEDVVGVHGGVSARHPGRCPLK